MVLKGVESCKIVFHGVISTCLDSLGLAAVGCTDMYLLATNTIRHRQTGDRLKAVNTEQDRIGVL